MADPKPAPAHVAGLWCDEVLGRLPDFLDGSLDATERQRVQDHLAGCDWCARFGGAYADTVQRLQEDLASAQPPDPDIAARLRARMAEELG